MAVAMLSITAPTAGNDIIAACYCCFIEVLTAVFKFFLLLLLLLLLLVPPSPP